MKTQVLHNYKMSKYLEHMQNNININELISNHRAHIYGIE